uniref:START domain-containing protein n=1 Tax=Leptobrachium leishanense TaxID=445787 RepID=A0A8C5LX93_9ANUR
MDYQQTAADVAKKIYAYTQDNTGWKHGKTTKDIVVSWKTSNEYSGHIYRGECIIEETPERIIPFLYLPKYRSKWDSSLESYNIVEQIDKDTIISQSLTHSYAMGMISPREFIDLIHVKRYDDGVLTTNSISLECAKCPVTSSYVRGYNNPCGYVCIPSTENPAHCKFVVFIQPELGGLLPRSLVESAIPTNLVTAINDIREGLKKYLD